MVGRAITCRNDVFCRIDQATAIVPRGAYICNPTHDVVANKMFSGLSAADAGDLNNYLLFNKPLSGEVVGALDNEGMVRPEDFLAKAATSHPVGGWALQTDAQQTTITIRHVLFHVIERYSVSSWQWVHAGVTRLSFARPQVAEIPRVSFLPQSRHGVFRWSICGGRESKRGHCVYDINYGVYQFIQYDCTMVGGMNIPG